ncbi:2,3-dihydro-2,3-dihydroxybenzoate dehydrogenase [Dactylosporangium siamense]|uniref:2,3-dihydro-2,3-dihydroxybenzoate dehydrogenase n=1 Tax=Dactylosporangium siamense TaxID=685454 RepID=A0A919PD80_9ACTN|nr:2,3-dihydro-2,3-dihydroxybenzoate dehydrogenase [Dactylosporangium siamense]GIG42630.1 2,3-dihydro-2,3-dihydroxybenzoate dehydrogenase [Dactylosporangium siamense]
MNGDPMAGDPVNGGPMAGDPVNGGPMDAGPVNGGLAGRTALVTGAARGIGAAVTRALAAQGARVVGVDLDLPGVDRLAGDLRRRGHDVHGRALDVRDTAAVEDLVGAVEDTLGPIDVLVNVAGILRTGAVLDLVDGAWQELLDVNLGGVVRCSRAVAGPMAARGRGAIVTVASNAAGVPRMRMAAYAASKAAAAHFTRCLGLELAGRGVRCNVVSPGSTDTPMLRMLGDSPGAVEAAVRGRPELFKTGIPLGRVAAPDDVAAAVLFLASDHARHITMQDLYVDGGAALHV